jgi:hypothetical protein
VLTITATADGTNVELQLASDAAFLEGKGVPASTSSEARFSLNAGDVLQLLGTFGGSTPMPMWGERFTDLSGSLVVADRPVQVIASVPITLYPPEKCCPDHMEEVVLPAEALGQHYVVPQPTAVTGEPLAHYVRFYGNFDATELTYVGEPPTNAPTALDAGQVVEIGPVAQSFEVEGSASFAIGSFLSGGQDVSSSGGDPAFSTIVAVPQFRRQYVFLAPDDYDTSYADILIPEGAKVLLDGQALSGSEESVGSWTLVRERLDAGSGGAHRLESSEPVGLQILGYGHATGYYTPGGLNVKIISDPPVIK